MAESKSRQWLIWTIGGIGAAVIAAMLIVKIWFATTVFMGDEETPVQTATSVEEPLDPTEQIVREMVTPAVPGTPVMPAGITTLDPTDYSRDLARFIPIEVGMDQFLAKDELLLHYNSEPESGAKVSSTERQINDATLFVIRRSGLADDSIAAEETYALFDDGVLADFGSRQQCRRGDTPNQWTTELCP